MLPTPGPLELVIILVIALLILGPGKLPDVGASLGKSIREFRKASSDVQEAVDVKVDASPLPPAPVPVAAEPSPVAQAVATDAAATPAPAANPPAASPPAAPASTTPPASSADTTSVAS